MKTLLRHTRTGLYLEAPDRWTQNPQAAYDFHFIDRAVQYAGTWELNEVELAFAFDNPQSVTTVSLNKTALHYAAAA